MLFFGYGLLSSYIIDFIRKFISGQIVLYILFGYLIFLIIWPVVLGLIAGTVGAFFALLFLLGQEKLKPRKWYSWMAVIVPLVCLIMIPFDFTSKVGWHEVKEDNFVKVEYDYFNGQHLIPIHGKQGERILFNVDHQVRQGNSTGITLYDKDRKHIGMDEVNDDILSVEFEEDTTHYIVVEAINGHEGQFQVNWWTDE